MVDRGPPGARLPTRKRMRGEAPGRERKRPLACDQLLPGHQGDLSGHGIRVVFPRRGKRFAEGGKALTSLLDSVAVTALSVMVETSVTVVQPR